MPGPDDLRTAWRHAWVRPGRDSVLAWATGPHGVHLDGAVTRRGRFNVDGSRYLEKAFELLSDDRVRMLNLAKSIQSAGSTVAEIYFYWTFKNRAGPWMITFQSDEDADQHFSTRMEPTFKASESLSALFVRLRRKRDLFKWPHMSAFIQGANVNSLQSKSIRYEWNDECWCWKPGMLEEAWGRTEAFRRVCKILNISQGGLTGTDWEKCWHSGRRYEHAVRCEQCHELQPLAFFAHLAADDALPESQRRRAGITWDRTARHADGRWHIARAAETARFTCRHCGHEHTNDARTWSAFDRTTDYICLDPDAPMANCSVRWNGLVSGDWGRLVRKFLEALEVRDSGSTKPLEQFYQKQLALFWDPTLAADKIELRTSAAFAKESPLVTGYRAQKFDWEKVRVITADYQQGKGNDTRHLIVHAHAWSDVAGRRSRLLWEGRCSTFDELYRLQIALGVVPACVCLDGSFEMMEVGAQCAKHGWTMLIGDDADYFPHKRKDNPGKPRRLPYSERFRVDPGKGRASQGQRFCWAFRWSNPAIKNVAWNLRHGLGAHQLEIPGDVSLSFREGIDSEAKRRIVQKKTGAPKWVWVQTILNNHPWDCWCMQVVVALIADCLTFDVEEDETPSAAPAPAVAAAAPVAPHDQPQQLELIPQ